MMDWQQATSLVIVAATAYLLIRQQVKRRRRARLRLCGQDCGCSSEVLERTKWKAFVQQIDKQATK